MRPSKVFLCALCALAVLAMAATAEKASRVLTFPIHDTFQDEGFSEFCGFDVFIHIEGQTRVMLKVNREGGVVREVDTFSATLTTFSDTGSFSFPLAQPIMFDYGEGAEIGSTATIKIVGFGGMFPARSLRTRASSFSRGRWSTSRPKGFRSSTSTAKSPSSTATRNQVRPTARPSAAL